MNSIQKSEAIKNGLRKGFQDGSSKIAKRKCYGYTINSDGELEINPDEAKVVSWIFERYLAGDSLGKIAAGLERRAFSPLPASPSGIVKQLTNCSPMKNTPDGCCSRKRSAPALSRSKTMASWNGISIPAPMRPLFLMRCSWQYNRRNSSELGTLKTRLL